MLAIRRIVDNFGYKFLNLLDDRHSTLYRITTILVDIICRVMLDTIIYLTDDLPSLYPLPLRGL